MRMEKVLQKLNPSRMRNRVFTRVRRNSGNNTNGTELLDLGASDSNNVPNSLQLRLIESSDSEGEEQGRKAESRPQPESFSVINTSDAPIYNPTSTLVSESMQNGNVEDPNGQDPNNDDLYLRQGRPGSRRIPKLGKVLCKISFWLAVSVIVFVLTVLITIIVVYITHPHGHDETHQSYLAHKTTVSINITRFFYRVPRPVKDLEDFIKPEPTEMKNEIMMAFSYESTTSDPLGEEDHLPTVEVENVDKAPITNTFLHNVYEESLKEFISSHKKDFGTTVDSTDWTKALHNASEKTLLIYQGQIMESAYRKMKERLGLSNLAADEGEVIFANITLPSAICPEIGRKKNCSSDPDTQEYRALDGICGNRKNPRWGSVNQQYRRLAFPVYEDGISAPRANGTFGRLPDPSTISGLIHSDSYSRGNSDMSSMLITWAQFLSYDIMNTAKLPDEHSNSCCNDGHGECTNTTDSSSHKDEGTSLNCPPHQRYAPYGKCHFGPKEQFNLVTAYIDASHLYGTEVGISSSLRKSNVSKEMKGFLQLQDHHHLLPEAYENETTLWCPEGQKECFKAGNPGINEFTTVTALHTLWAREHNRVAQLLLEINPSWDDERIFQEARRIIIAQIQHITFNEFLPTLLGEELLGDLKTVKAGSFYRDFDVDANPGISNEFTIAFQFFWSLIQGTVLTKNVKHLHHIPMKKLMGNPIHLKVHNGTLDAIIAGLCEQPTKEFGPAISKHIKEQSHEVNDMFALLLQEGRDKGIAPYVEVAKRCNLPKIKSFSEITDLWYHEALQHVSLLFNSVEDVDLLTGMLCEKPWNGSRVGPTVACIIGEQFSRLRKGDMFWYESDIHLHHFQRDQLDAITKSSLAGIICANTGNIKNIQRKVFLVPSDKTNPVVHCKDIPIPNLRQWKEKEKKNEPKNSGKSDKHSHIMSNPEEKDYGRMTI